MVSKELDDVVVQELSNDDLNIMQRNGEDPGVLALLRGMDLKQLDYFKSIDLTQEGFVGLMKLNAHWMQDAMNLNGLDEKEDISYCNCGCCCSDCFGIIVCLYS